MSVATQLESWNSGLVIGVAANRIEINVQGTTYISNKEISGKDGEEQNRKSNSLWARRVLNLLFGGVCVRVNRSFLIRDSRLGCVLIDIAWLSGSADLRRGDGANHVHRDWFGETGTDLQ